MAMALRAGLTLRDMEMVQFHPTGLLAGENTRMTGTILEEGLRGSGGYLLNGNGERFMQNYDSAGERATRDIVSRSMHEEVRSGRGTANGGLYIRMAHLGPENVAKQFKGMVKRCADCGFDLAAGNVEVTPTAHYMMGGIEFNGDCSTGLNGLYAAGEDTGGVHGANRLGGNGVGNSTVFGAVAGDCMAKNLPKHSTFREPDENEIDRHVNRCDKPFKLASGDINLLREELMDVMWEEVGIVRSEKQLLSSIDKLDDLEHRLQYTGLSVQQRAFNLTWHDWLNLESQIMVSKTIAHSALRREDSRGAHYRSDHPHTLDLENSTYTTVSLGTDGILNTGNKSVDFTIVKPGQSLIEGEAGAPVVNTS